MLLKGAAAAKSLAQPDAAVRLYILGGPDQSGSQALMKSFAATMGADAECTSFTARQLQEDPALLADEAASISLFGGRRWISVMVFTGGGDDILPACENLLSAPAAGNPVVVIVAGATARSKIIKLAEKAANAIAVLSHPPISAHAGSIITTLAEPFGLKFASAASRALADATSGDRGLMAREIEKIALFLDSAPDQPKRVELADWQAIGAALPDEDVGDAVAVIMGGRLAQLPALFSNLEATGVNEIALLRMLSARAALLARLALGMANGQSASQAVESAGKAVFWKDKDMVVAQLNRWHPAKLARLIDRLHTLERALKRPDNAGTLLFRNDVTDITRAAASTR
ncbi:MAG: DNA polymerase III subunit delta [Sphingopyxis sp.]